MSFPFVLTINTSTLRPYRLGVEEQIMAAADAGFAAIELWVRDLEPHRTGGLAAIRRLAQDTGIEITNAIAFFKWADADKSVRASELEQARREMGMLAEIGCTAVAAPPTGELAGLSLAQIGESFANLLELARPLGVEPILEFWGRAPVLHSIREARDVLDACGDDRATVLLDLFHMYTGGSSLADVALLAESAMRVGLVHINDYPAVPPKAIIRDADRVMPGDGIAPVGEFLRALDKIGFAGPLSVELFREDYGDSDATATARQAARKTLSAWDR